MTRLLRESVTTAVLVFYGVLMFAKEGLGGNFFDDMYNSGKISKESSSMEAMWAAEFEGKPYVTKPPKVTEDPLLALLTEKPKTGMENMTTSKPVKSQISGTPSPDENEDFDTETPPPKYKPSYKFRPTTTPQMGATTPSSDLTTAKTKRKRTRSTTVAAMIIPPTPPPGSDDAVSGKKRRKKNRS